MSCKLLALETKISPVSKASLKMMMMIFLLQRVGYVSSLNGTRTSLTGFVDLLFNRNWILFRFAGRFDAKAYDLESNLSELRSEAKDPASIHHQTI